MGKWDDWTNFIKANNGTDGRTFAEFYADIYKEQLEEAKTREDIDKILEQIKDKKLNEIVYRTRNQRAIPKTEAFNVQFNPALEEKTDQRNVRDIIRTSTRLKTLRDLDIKIAGTTRSSEEQKVLHRRLSMIRGQNIRNMEKTIRRYEDAYDKLKSLAPAQLMEKNKYELRTSFPEADVSYIKSTGRLPKFRLTIGMEKGQIIKDPTDLITQFKKERKILS